MQQPPLSVACGPSAWPHGPFHSMLSMHRQLAYPLMLTSNAPSPLGPTPLHTPQAILMAMDPSTAAELLTELGASKAAEALLVGCDTACAGFHLFFFNVLFPVPVRGRTARSYGHSQAVRDVRTLLATSRMPPLHSCYLKSSTTIFQSSILSFPSQEMDSVDARQSILESMAPKLAAETVIVMDERAGGVGAPVGAVAPPPRLDLTDVPGGLLCLVRDERKPSSSLSGYFHNAPGLRPRNDVPGGLSWGTWGQTGWAVGSGWAGYVAGSAP